MRHFLILGVAAILLAATSASRAAYGGGTGTPEDPYQIWDAEEMNTIGLHREDWDKCFALMDDIDLSGYDGIVGQGGFNVLGFDPNDWAASFTGVFEGGGHRISGLMLRTQRGIRRPECLGLFSVVEGEGASVRDLELFEPKIEVDRIVGSPRWIGFVVGHIRGGAEVVGCRVTGGIVNGESPVPLYYRESRTGLLAGEISGGKIVGCSVSGEVWGDDSVGGLVAWNTGGEVADCNAIVTVSGYTGTGGLIGYNRGKVSNCHVVVDVEGNGGYHAGGLIGSNEGVETEVSNCSVRGRVVSVPENPDIHRVGGLIGRNYESTVRECLADVEVVGSAMVGGLAGSNSGAGALIRDSHATGNVSGVNRVGGLVGRNSAILERCSARCNVVGDEEVGGLVGWHNYRVISECFSTGDVEGKLYVGGLIGWLDSNGIVNDCYSRGTVCGEDYVGGLVGAYDGYYTEIRNCYCVATVEGTGDNVWGFGGVSSSISNSYWNADVSGLDEILYLKASINCRGLSTRQMWMYENYAMWGEGEVWSIDDRNDYPHLAWEGIDGEVIKATRYGGGSGTEDDPYLIGTVRDLNTIGACWGDWNKHFRMTADIDLRGLGSNGFNMIGHWDRGGRGEIGFMGSFDGGGFAIRNFTNVVDLPENPYGWWKTGVGVFRMVGIKAFSGERGGVIENVRVVDPNVYEEGVNWVGGLAGYVHYEGVVRNCSVEGGRVAGKGYVGGVVGRNRGTIEGCFASCTVEGEEEGVGGLVGDSYTIIRDCRASGDVSGLSRVGGLVGYQSSFGSISNCGATGRVSGDDVLGGLCGSNYESEITNCYATGAVTGHDYLGGLCGHHQGVFAEISNCYATGVVTGNDYLGGLCGYQRGPGTWNWKSEIINCYATGSVIGSDESENIGGVCGGYEYSSFSSSFWDVDTSGMTEGVGYQDPDPNGVNGKSTIELKTLSTFTDAGWDFVGEDLDGVGDVWRMCLDGVGYPRLSWEYSRGGDFDCGDGVGVEDLVYLAGRWLMEGDFAGAADADGDGVVGLADFGVMGEAWGGD